MKTVCVIGHFGYGKKLLNGQTIKTKIVTRELKKKLGSKRIKTIDTHGGLVSYVRLPFQLLYSLLVAQNIIILPAHNGVRIMSPLLIGLNILFRRNLHYIVIGGWLPSLLAKKHILRKCLKRFTGIYVETKTMKQALDNLGFKNIYIMPNSKNLHILKEDDLIYYSSEPLRVCTFSRVMKEKGIEDAIEVVKKVNHIYQRNVYHLDIYGQIEEDQEEWFQSLSESFPDFVRYCGKVDFDKTVETIKNYYALLFPTKFYTEGIPGTIIDAYAAGVPVVSSEWESFDDVIENNVTGIGYSFDNKGELEKILLSLANDPEQLNKLKVNCLHRAAEFTTAKAINELMIRIK